ncbi:hypothetical protein [Luteimonas panaciterrae]|uniref:hypothetical protein n=1 Tax=Luteimonas panaciterrae TaxID=363885 RepID=UPI001CFADF9D|nr:hypothetical protein [Luteimonas panaciterrae]
MKLKGLFALILVGLIFFTHQAFSNALGQPKKYGPYVCDSCAEIGRPVPDRVTQSIINKYENEVGPAIIGFSPGDLVIVCNSSICVTYEQTEDGNYYEVEVKNRVLTRPPTGGTGGGGGGHGGTPGGGGSSGSVKVGDVEQVKK